jgi:hypothetical protein
MHVQGPNFLWSVDGYDKLSHWGFYVHGCIDAYSRYIIWLQIGITNKKSQVILKYYLDAINELKGKNKFYILQLEKIYINGNFIY